MNRLSAELSKRLVRPVEADVEQEGAHFRVYIRLGGGWVPVCTLYKQDLYRFPYDDVAESIVRQLRMRKLPRNKLKKDA